MTDQARHPQIVFDTIDSTNEEARRRVLAGDRQDIWLAARLQEQGRGRQGRVWQSPSGNLFATRLHCLDATPAEAARLSFVTALAVADTISALAPGIPVTLKWPNDVLLAEKKVCGILLDNFGPDGTGTLALGIGIGINLAHHPDPSQSNWPPTSIAAETGVAPSFDDGLSLLSANLDERLFADRPFAETRKEWLSRASHLGQEIQVRLPKETITGRFADLDEEGVLILEGGDGPRRIAAGDVHFPGGTDAARH